MATTLTRVTVSGVGKNAELLLPNDQPIATILPRLTEILGDPQPHHEEATRTVLNRIGGPALSERATLADEGISDGAWLYLTSTEDALPEPIVFDVADVVEDELPALSNEAPWSAPGLVSTTLGAACLVIAAWILNSWHHDLLGRGTAALSLVCLTAAAALPRRLTTHSVALCAATLACTGIYLHSSEPRTDQLLIIAAAAIGGVQAAREIHRRSYRGALALIGTIALVTSLWAAAWRFMPDHHSGAACVGVACCFAVGLCPRFAVALAGLNSLDDARIAGASVRRQSVVNVLSTAHRALVASLLWLAASSVIAAVAITRGADQTWRWDLPLIASWGLLLLLRARHFPLALEKLPLALAGLVTLTVTFVSLTEQLNRTALDGALVALLILACLGSFLATHLQPATHVAAQARLVADRVETLAALLVVPLLVGHFGVYSSLAHTFQK